MQWLYGIRAEQQAWQTGALSHDHLMVRVSMTWAAANSVVRVIASPHFNPTQRLSNLRDQFPLRRDEDVARLAEGLRLAGMPE